MTVVHDGTEGSEFPEVPRSGPSGVTYVDAQTKRDFSAKIVEIMRAGGQYAGNELLRFALTPSYGGNRNSIQLLHAGERYVSIDDDCVFRFGSLDRSNVMESNRFMTAFSDRIEDIERLLGSYTGDPIADLLDVLTQGSEQETSVFAAMAGTYGVRWFSRPHTILFASSEFHRFSYSNKRRYIRLRRSPVGATQVPRTTLSATGAFTAGCSSTDGTRLLPPYPPLIRPEDSYWGTLATALIKNGRIAQLPFCIYHDSRGKEPFREDEFRSVVADPGLISYLVLHERLKGLPDFDEETVYEIVGDRLIEISGLNDDEWTNYCHELWLNYIGNAILDARENLEAYHAKPRWWARDMRQFIDEAKKVSLSKDLVNLEWDGRGYARRYGELVTIWPSIWRAAVELNQSGEGAAQ